MNWKSKFVLPAGAALAILLAGCGGSISPSACYLDRWDKRVAKERLLAARYPADEYLTGLGDGPDYASAAKAATADLSRKVSVEVESELKTARSYYKKNKRESYLETFDEVIVERTAFAYGALIEADKRDAFPWCDKMVALVRAPRGALVREMTGKTAGLARQLQAAAASSLEAAERKDTKAFVTSYRQAASLLAELDVEAAQFSAIAAAEPEELQKGRQMVLDLAAEGQRLMGEIRPCITVRRGEGVPEQVVSQVADSLDRAFSGLGMQGRIGGCETADGLWIVDATPKPRCKAGAAAAYVCTGVLHMEIKERASGTVLSSFDLTGPAAKGLYGESDALNRSFGKLLESDPLRDTLSKQLAHLVPVRDGSAGR